MSRTVEVRPVDRARAAQMIAAQLTGDAEMFATAVAETFDDDGGVGATVAVLRCMSEDLAFAIRDRRGEQAVELIRNVIASEREQEES